MIVYTLTLNPAFDVHARVDGFSACKENFACITQRDAGGKGINISRALSAVGVDNTPIVVVGDANGKEFVSRLGCYGLKSVVLEREGSIRENLTLHHDGQETRISFSGFAVDECLLDKIAQLITPGENTVLTFTGSIPKGISVASAKAFLIALREKGVKIVLDCRSFGLEDVKSIRPWLVKPNQQEVSEWFGEPVETMEQAAACAEKLYDLGVENAMVSMGHEGAVLACGKTYIACAPQINAVSTIGAGDSSIAGFVYAAAEGREVSECLRIAVAFGSAACLTKGTQPPQRASIEDLYDQITVMKSV